MKHLFKHHTLAAAVALALCSGGAHAAVYVQCPGDTDGDALWNSPGETPPAAPTKCMHLTAGDGFAVGSDGHPLYTFGYSDRTGTLPSQVINKGILGAHWPGPSIELEEDQHFYLSLTNVGSALRPDLFDPHTVHFHGFPNAAPVFDGVPELSIAINQGSTISYYYNIKDPGTYIYHCHVQATEHMEMGMLANLYVHPKQDKTGCANGSCPVATRQGGAAGAPLGYVYNDNDGTTAYDVEVPLQVSGFDANFHDANLKVQPLPFAMLKGNYPQINGRGYPDTVKAKLALGAPKDDSFVSGTPGKVLNNGETAQDMSSLITVTKGQRLLLRFSNVSIDRFYTLTAPGLTMKLVGVGAKLLRGTDGKNLYQDTASINFGGGETHDVIIETADVAPGTYFLHAAELHQMSNKTQMDGGLITEIVVN